MRAMPFEYAPQYWDTCKHSSVSAAALRFVDSSFEPHRWCAGIADETHRKETIEGLINAVMRRNILTIHEPWDKWVDYGEGGVFGSQAPPPPFHLTTELVGVGSTSFQVRFEIASAGRPVAAVDSTLVCIGGVEALTQKRQVPYGDELRASLRPGLQPPPQTTLLREAPADALVWSQPVRSTDCDGFGHINQAVYATLVEEARAAAGKTAPVRILAIEYLGQPVPLDVLSIKVWEAEGCEHFQFDVEGKGLVALARVEPSTTWEPWTCPRI